MNAETHATERRRGRMTKVVFLTEADEAQGGVRKNYD